LGAAVAVLAAGSLVRLAPVLPALVAGSVLVGLGIGSAGALVTGVVKRHLAPRAGTVTGGYVVAMMIGAAVTSLVAVPLAVLLGGWSRSLAVWAVPAALAVGFWAPLARGHPRAAPAARGPFPWRSGFARLASCYMAGTSVQFYGWLTWLSPYYQHLGWSTQRAALLQALWSVAQIPAALGASALAERRHRWVFWTSATLACGVTGTLGLLVAPLAAVVGPWAWVVLGAIGVGGGFPLGLAVIAWRTSDGAEAGAVSGMAMGFGYLFAGVAPLLMGLLLDATGGYSLPLGVLLAAGATQATVVLLIGDGTRRRPAASCGRAASR
jgi:CP family cyanate transporter-like MFS transporter